MELPRHRTDVIVLGGELAGLFTAALLAKKGLRCKVMGHGELEGYLTAAGVLLPEIPFLVSDFEASSALHRVIEELGLRQDVRRLIPFCQPTLQLVDGTHRLDLPDDEQARVAELQREFGEHGPPLAALLRGLDDRATEIASWIDAAPGLCEAGFFARRAFNKHLAAAERVQGAGALWLRLPAGQALLPWLSGLVPFASHVGDDTAASLPAERAIARLLLGTRHSTGGERAMLARLARGFVTSHGGEVKADCRVARVELRRNEAVVELAGDRTEYLASFLVDASRAAWLEPVLAPDRAARQYAANRALVTNRDVVVAQHWVLKPAGLPQGIGHKLLVHTAEGRTVLLAVDHLARPAEGDRSVLDGSSTLSAACLARADAQAAGRSYLREVVDELLPFVEPHVVAEHEGQARPLYTLPDQEPVSALGPLRPVVTEHPRLLRVGCDVLPAWGLEGELRSALKVSEQIATKVLGRRSHGDLATPTTA